MKRGRVRFAIVAVTLVCVAFAGFAKQEETASAYSFALGGRLQSDQTFYVQGGFIAPNFDAVIGVGWNDSTWIGVHGYVLPGPTGSGFIGLEGHLGKNDAGALAITPAFAFGFAMKIAEGAAVIEGLILPVPEGHGIETILSVSFMFTLFSFGG